MAIIVEDGTGLADAETYCSVAAFRAYCDGRGMLLTGITDSTIEQWLRQANDYLAGYTTNWKGERLTATQALDWPRRDVYLNGSLQLAAPLPRALVDAAAALAFKAQSGPLLVDTRPAAGGAAIKKIKLGPLEKEYQAPTASGTSDAPRYPAIDRMLGALVRPSRAYMVPLRRS